MAQWVHVLLVVLAFLALAVIVSRAIRLSVESQKQQARRKGKRPLAEVRGWSPGTRRKEPPVVADVDIVPMGGTGNEEGSENDPSD